MRGQIFTAPKMNQGEASQLSTDEKKVFRVVYVRSGGFRQMQLDSIPSIPLKNGEKSTRKALHTEVPLQLMISLMKTKLHYMKSHFIQ